MVKYHSKRFISIQVLYNYDMAGIKHKTNFDNIGVDAFKNGRIVPA